MTTEYPLIARQVELQQQYVQIEGRVWSCMVRSGAATLVLVTSSHQDYRQYLELLSFLDPALGIVIVELPGHRESRVLPKHLSIEAFADDILSVLRQTTAGAWFIGGHSIGGMISLEVGRRHPARLQGVIAIEGWTSMQAAVDAFEGVDMHVTLSPALRERHEEMRRQATGHLSPDERSRFSRVWTEWDSGESFLRTTELSILEIWGDRGRARPRLSQLRIPERQNIYLHWVAGASHNLPLERPRELAEAIDSFIKHLLSQND